MKNQTISLFHFSRPLFLIKNPVLHHKHNWKSIIYQQTYRISVNLLNKNDKLFQWPPLDIDTTGRGTWARPLVSFTPSLTSVPFSFVYESNKQESARNQQACCLLSRDSIAWWKTPIIWVDVVKMILGVGGSFHFVVEGKKFNFTIFCIILKIISILFLFCFKQCFWKLCFLNKLDDL